MSKSKLLEFLRSDDPLLSRSHKLRLDPNHPNASFIQDNYGLTPLFNTNLSQTHLTCDEREVIDITYRSKTLQSRPPDAFIPVGLEKEYMSFLKQISN